MDNLHSGFEGSGHEAYDPAEDDVGAETPPVAIGQDERRLQVRAYNHWASLLGERPFPVIDDLKAGELPDFDTHSVLLDFSKGISNPQVRYLGASVAEECEADVATIRKLSDVPGRSLLSRITDHYMQIIANQTPIGFEAEFVNQRGKTILYRGILLPFSSGEDSTAIDLVYGVINWKELADQATTDALLSEIDKALEVRSARLPAPVVEWADGPADTGADILDLVTPYDEVNGELDWPQPAFGAGEQLSAPLSLGDWLDSARELARAAHGSEDRSRQALYAAIGRAHDFALAAAAEPEEFRELVADAGLTMQDRAPLTPVVKLVFGSDYDKTRLTEFAAAIAHAQRLGLACGALAAHLSQAPGGLKGVVHAERRLRREEQGKTAPAPAARELLASRLREITVRSLATLASDGEEFTLVLARRLDDGSIGVVGEIANDDALFERAARAVLG